MNKVKSFYILANGLLIYDVVRLFQAIMMMFLSFSQGRGKHHSIFLPYFALALSERTFIILITTR